MTKEPVAKTRATFNLPTDLVNRLEAAVTILKRQARTERAANPKECKGKHVPSLSSVIEAALREWLERHKTP